MNFLKMISLDWYGILLFLNKDNHVKFKAGEKINVFSQVNKEDLYNNCKNVKTFKIYVRVLFKYHDSERVIISGELAKSENY